MQEKDYPQAEARRAAAIQNLIRMQQAAGGTVPGAELLAPVLAQKAACSIQGTSRLTAKDMKRTEIDIAKNSEGSQRGHAPEARKFLDRSEEQPNNTEEAVAVAVAVQAEERPGIVGPRGYALTSRSNMVLRQREAVNKGSQDSQGHGAEPQHLQPGCAPWQIGFGSRK